MMQYEVEGKNFLITGGASRLGAAYVETFLGMGAKNIAVLDIAEDAGKALADRLNKTNKGKVIFIKCDVSKEEDIAKAFNEVADAFQQIDVLINNAGIMVDAPEMWRTACDVNYQGVVSFTMKGINHMNKAEGGAGGTIINISSVFALIISPYLSTYSGAKMAVLHFSQSIAVEPFFEQTGVRILTMCPGFTDTHLIQGRGTLFQAPLSYSLEMGKRCVEMVKESSREFHKVSSAVNAFMLMYKTGPPGSIWYSGDYKPGRDITSIVDAAFDGFQKRIIQASDE